jgi:hypothetical protein
MVLYMNFKDKVLSLCPEFKNDILSEGQKYIGYLSYLTAFSLILQSYHTNLVAKALLKITVSERLVPATKEDASKRGKLLTALLETSVPGSRDDMEVQIVQKIKKQLQSFESHLIALKREDDPEADDFKVLFKTFPKFLTTDSSI